MSSRQFGDEILGTDEGDVCRQIRHEGSGGDFGTDTPGIAQGDGDARGQGARIFT
jgi:hypothetical protein